MGIQEAQAEIDRIHADHGVGPDHEFVDPLIASRVASLRNKIAYLRRKNEKKSEKARLRRQEAMKSPAAKQAKVDAIQARLDRKNETLAYYQESHGSNPAYYDNQITMAKAQIKSLEKRLAEVKAQ